MKLRNPHRHRVTVPTLGVAVEAGATVDATGDDARTLQAQGWRRVGSPKPRKTSATKAEPTTPEAPASTTEED